MAGAASDTSEIAKAQRPLKTLSLLIVALAAVATTAVAIPYRSLARRVDRQLESGALLDSVTYYAAPETISVGDPAPTTLGRHLRQESEISLDVDSVPPATIQLAAGKVSAIIDQTNHQSDAA